MADFDASCADSFHLEEFDGAPVGTGEDPLEWLMENDTTMQHLPESSLVGVGPIFPDFTSDLTENSVQLQPQLLQPHGATTSHHHLPDVMDTLPNLADPKVTVQSLFMEED